MEKDEIEDVLQRNIEECLSAVECFEEEDSNSRESLSLAEYAYVLSIVSLKYLTLDSILAVRVKIWYVSSYSEGILHNSNF